MEFQAVAQFAVNNRLGEGVQWHADSNSVWWTDIHGCQLYRLHWPTQHISRWQTPERLSAFSLVSLSPLQLRVAFASGFADYWPDLDRYHWLARPELNNPGNRFNDGRLDRQGRFWAGTMVEDASRSTTAGCLYRLDDDGCQPQLRDLQIPNALCWTRDSRFMYHADSPSQQILRYDFDAVSGQASRPIPFTSIDKGVPDGAFVDRQDRLWVAIYEGAAVRCYSADGELVANLELPLTLPTCVCVGGSDDDLLFITSAREGLSTAQFAEQPLAGALLVYRIAD